MDDFLLFSFSSELVGSKELTKPLALLLFCSLGPSMGNEKVVGKPLLPPLSAMKKLPPPSPCLLAEVRVFSLLAALLFACGYAGLAFINIRDGGSSPPCQQVSFRPLAFTYECSSTL